MRILFIKIKHIGDTLLLTPTIDAVKQKYPHSEVSVLIRSGCEQILAGCKSIDEILTTAPPEKDKRGIRSLWSSLNTIRRLIAKRFDYVFCATTEDRSILHALLARSKYKALNPYDIPALAKHSSFLFNQQPVFDFRSKHTILKDYELVRPILGLPDEPGPMKYSEDGERPVFNDKLAEEFVVIHPLSRWESKQWNPDNWKELVKWLSKRVNQIIVSNAPNSREQEFAEQLASQFQGTCIFKPGGLPFPELAYLLKRARLYIGIDSVATHLAAACDCPSAVLFGTTCEIEFAPWKVPHKVIALPKTKRQIINGIDTSKTYSCMADIPLDFAMTQITELLNETR